MKLDAYLENIELKKYRSSRKKNSSWNFFCQVGNIDMKLDANLECSRNCSDFNRTEEVTCFEEGVCL